jgi:hypothetical protein
MKDAELLLAKSKGRWDFGEFRAKVVGKAPVVVLVESELGVCGGFAAVPFQDKMDEFVADPTGASFVFSLRPAAARYPLKDKSRALCLRSGGGGGFDFGVCLAIYSDGDIARYETTYAVPSGWATGDYVKVTRLEVWRVAS